MSTNQNSQEQDPIFKLDQENHCIVTFITDKTVPTSLEFMNVTSLVRTGDMPEPDESLVVKYNLSLLSGIPREKHIKVLEEITGAFEKLYKEELIVVLLENVPGLSLTNFVPNYAEAGVLQWEPNDIKQVLRAVRVACGVVQIMH